jgi:hypothetical protein
MSNKLFLLIPSTFGNAITIEADKTQVPVFPLSD